MATQGLWQTGQQILQQDLWLGKLITARPVTVVEDSPARLALYTHPGAPYYSATTISRNRHSLTLSERVDILMSDDIPPLEPRVSGSRHVLTLTTPGAAHSVWLFWSSEWEFLFWYVNLQAPIRRTPRGILVQDQVLDIVAGPDLAWNWKDEDDFEALVERGFFTREQAASIRAEGERMAAAIERNDSPFCEGWKRWRPDAGWLVPEVPEDWAVVSQVV